MKATTSIPLDKKAPGAGIITDNFNIAEFSEATFHFWFNNHDHIRSPFPEYMREELSKIATMKLSEWISKISAKAKKDVNEEILVEKFEEIIFEAALVLAQSNDEKISIRYPFMPRTGDKINVKGVPEETAESIVTARQIKKNGEDQKAYLEVNLTNVLSGKNWNTRFELDE